LKINQSAEEAVVDQGVGAGLEAEVVVQDPGVGAGLEAGVGQAGVDRTVAQGAGAEASQDQNLGQDQSHEAKVGQKVDQNLEVNLLLSNQKKMVKKNQKLKKTKRTQQDGSANECILILCFVFLKTVYII